ncbi:MAG: hypothetical protein ACP5C4_02105 [Methanomicrobiales archaeon]
MDRREYEPGRLVPAQERKIKDAASNTCDRCGYTYPPRRLVVRVIDTGLVDASSVLVLCPDCLMAVLKIPIAPEDQRSMAGNRPDPIQGQITAVIRRRSQPIHIDSGYDPADIFEDWFFVLNGA